MKRFAILFPLFPLFPLLLLGCVSSTYLVFNSEKDSQPWQISLTIEANSLIVTVNDSTVINEGLGLFPSSGEFSGSYKDSAVKVLLDYTRGVFGIGSGWKATILIDGKLAGRFKL